MKIITSFVAFCQKKVTQKRDNMQINKINTVINRLREQRANQEFIEGVLYGMGVAR